MCVSVFVLTCSIHCNRQLKKCIASSPGSPLEKQFLRRPGHEAKILRFGLLVWLCSQSSLSSIFLHGVRKTLGSEALGCTYMYVYACV